MSEKITATNLAKVVEKNCEIREEILQKVQSVRITCNRMQVSSASQLALQILRPYGLLQMPIENHYWSGAIFVRDDIRIPVINTAQPRANQYFTAWHEIYHLMFDKVSFDHIIESEALVEERKAEYFASLMLLGNLMPFYLELPEMTFISKVFHCMNTFQAPYKAVLISLYEEAWKSNNKAIMDEILKCIDADNSDITKYFRELGLDDNLVKPSYVINCGDLQAKISTSIRRNPEINYNSDNAAYLSNLLNEMNLLVGEKDERNSTL